MQQNSKIVNFSEEYFYVQSRSEDTKTKKAISDAFWELMQTRDFSEISVNDISEKAMISRTTFYHHYTDKYDWLERTVSDMIAEHIVTFDMTKPDEPKEAIRSLCLTFQNIQQNAHLYMLLIKNSDDRLLRNRFQTSLLQAFYDHHGQNAILSASDELTIHFISASTAAIFEWWIRNNQPLTPIQMAQLVYTYRFGNLSQIT